MVGEGRVSKKALQPGLQQAQQSGVVSSSLPNRASGQANQQQMHWSGCAVPPPKDEPEQSSARQMQPGQQLQLWELIDQTSDKSDNRRRQPNCEQVADTGAWQGDLHGGVEAWQMQQMQQRAHPNQPQQQPQDSSYHAMHQSITEAQRDMIHSMNQPHFNCLQQPGMSQRHDVPAPFGWVPFRADYLEEAAPALTVFTGVSEQGRFNHGGRPHREAQQKLPKARDKISTREKKGKANYELSEKKMNDDHGSGRNDFADLATGEKNGAWKKPHTMITKASVMDRTTEAGKRDDMDVLTIDSVMTGMHTMKEQLEALRHVDPATVFIARRINKLGFASADTLRSHFSCYGLVKDVLVSHSRVKSFKSTGRRRRGVGEHQRLRAAGLGFVVMGSAEDAAKILNEGPEHNILGAVVQLQPFHHHSLIEDASSLDNSDLIAASDKMLAQAKSLIAGSLQHLDEGEEADSMDANGRNFGSRERWHSPGSDTSNHSPRIGGGYWRTHPDRVDLGAEVPTTVQLAIQQAGQSAKSHKWSSCYTGGTP